MNNVQPSAYQDLLDAGAGLFHATELRCRLPILRDGVLKMSRAASMFSMFHHMDTPRAKNLQRFGSDYEIIISIRSQESTKYVSLSDMCCVWKCFNPGSRPALRFRPDRAAQQH